MTKAISTAELQRMQESNDEFQLLDVLSAAEFETDHIPGSKSAPIDAANFLSEVERDTGGDKQSRIVVYCGGKSCDASTRAAKRLEEAGYTSVSHYPGGMQEWNELHAHAPGSSADVKGE